MAEQCDTIDILINNAGISSANHPNDPIMGVSKLDMENCFRTNVVGPVLLTQKLWSLLEKGSSPEVVNISSRYALQLFGAHFISIG